MLYKWGTFDQNSSFSSLYRQSCGNTPWVNNWKTSRARSDNSSWRVLGITVCFNLSVPAPEHTDNWL